MNTTFPLTLYYDGSCPLCQAEMRNLQLRDVHEQLRFVDISIAGVDGPPGTDRAALMELIHARCADGRVLRGVEVFRLAYSAAGLRWVAMISRLPVVGALCEAMYPVIARNRHRLPRRLIRWLFGIALRRATSQRAGRHCSAACRIEPDPPASGNQVCK